MFRTEYFCLLLSVLYATTLASSPVIAANTATTPQSKLKMTRGETAIYVADMHCKTCAKKIARKLYTVKGVVKVRTNVKADVAIVTPQKNKKIDPLALWSAAKASGFPAVKLVGPAGTFVPHPETQAAQKLSDAEAAAENQG